MAATFQEIFESILNFNAPLRKKRIRPDPAPWITPETESKISNMFDIFGTRAILHAVCGDESDFAYECGRKARALAFHLKTDDLIEMATNKSEFLNEAILEEKLVDLWPEYPCVYDVRSPNFKDRVRRDMAIHEIAENQCCFLYFKQFFIGRTVR
eukprot:gene3897-4441_t